MASGRKEDNLVIGAKGGAIAFTLKVATTLLNLINQIIFARIIGAGGVGEVLLALSVIKVSSQFAKFGIEETMMRFIPVYLDQQDRSRLKGTIYFALGFSLITSILFVLLIVLLSKFISINIFHSDMLERLLPVVAFSLPAVVIRDIVGGIMKGYKDAYRALLPEAVISPIFRIMIFLVLTLKGITPMYAIIAFVLGEMIAVAVSIRFLLSKVSDIGESGIRCDIKRILGVAYSVIFASVSLFLYTQTDLWVLGYFKEKDVVGVYGITAKMVLLVYFPMFAFASIVPSLFSSSYALGDHKELKRVTRQSSRWILSMAMPIVLGLFLEGRFVLRYFYGAEFEGGYIVLVILTIGHLINTSTGLVGLFLQMTGKHRFYMRINIFYGLLNLILNIILVPSYGMIGAAISTAFCLSMLELTCTIFVYKHFSISMLPEDFKFDIIFMVVFSILYLYLSYTGLYSGYHLLLLIALTIYTWKSITRNDIPWRLLIARFREV